MLSQPQKENFLALAKLCGGATVLVGFIVAFVFVSDNSLRNGSLAAATATFGDITLTLNAATSTVLSGESTELSWSVEDTANLVAHYTFDEGTSTTAGDSSGNSYDGTLTNGPTWTSGTVGSGALSFDGVDDYVGLPLSGSVANTNTYTISGWFKGGTQVSANEGVPIYAESNSSNNFPRLELGLEGGSGGRAYVFIRSDSGAGTASIYSSSQFNDSTWHHIALVRSGSASFQLFVDGVSQGSSNSTIGATTVNTIRVAERLRPYDNPNFTGTIDDVRVYSRALSDAEVQALAGSGGTPSCTLSDGTNTLWSGTYGSGSVDSGALTTDTTFTLDCATIGSVAVDVDVTASASAVSIVGKSDAAEPSTNGSFTFQADTAPTYDLPVYYQIASSTANDGASCTTDIDYLSLNAGAAPPTAGLVAHWPFDEGGGLTAYDVTGQAVDGILSSSSSRTLGRVGSGSAYFNGVEDHITLGNYDIPATDALTISAWFNTYDAQDCSTNDCRIISKAFDDANQAHYWMLSLIDGRHPRFRLRTDGNTDVYISNATVSSNIWYHYAAVYDGATVTLYLDGVNIGSWPKTGTIDMSTTTEVQIGNNPPTYYGVFEGSIDDIRIYNVALTPEEIATLAEGSGTYIAAGSTESGPISVVVCDDTVNEDDETIGIVVQDPGDGTYSLGTLATTTVTIFDDEEDTYVPDLEDDDLTVSSNRVRPGTTVTVSWDIDDLITGANPPPGDSCILMTSPALSGYPKSWSQTGTAWTGSDNPTILTQTVFTLQCTAPDGVTRSNTSETVRITPSFYEI